MTWGLSIVAFTEFGAGIFLAAPPMMIAGGVATAISIIGAIREDMKIEKQRAMFNACGLYLTYKNDNGDYRVYPSIISNGENYMLIDLPNMMGIKDVINKHGLIENYYSKNVIIEQTSNKKVLIKRLDPGANEQDRWLVIFNLVGLVGVTGKFPKLVDSEVNSIGQKVIFTLPAQLIVKDFQDKKSELESILKCKLDIKDENYKLVIQTLTRQFKEMYKIDFRNHILPDMKFIIGVGRDGEQLIMDLGGNEFSTLVCGASGSGKSVFLNCLMVQFILKGIEIFSIDLKAVDFRIFRNYKKMTKYASCRKEAIQVLADAYDLMLARYKILEEKNCKSYVDYNKKFNQAMPPIVVIIDEYSVLMEDKKAKFFLFELLSRCRATNILTIICTQTPRAKILDTSIRCNIKNTVCFSCETDADSEVALGQKGNYRAARELNAIGRGFLKSKGQLIEFQGYFLEDREIESQVATQMTRPVKTHSKSPVPSEKVIPLEKKKPSQDIEKLLSKIDGM